MDSFLDFILPKKSNLLYKTALNSTKSLEALFKLYREGDFNIKIDDHEFQVMFPNEKNSPAIYWIDQNQYLIRYPERSKPYNHTFDNKCKFVECLSGKLFDRNSDFKLFKGDKVKIHPKDNYQPYTIDEPCYLRVCIGNCSEKLEDVCR